MSTRSRLIEASDLHAKSDSDTFRLEAPEILKLLIQAEGTEPPQTIRIPSGSSGTAPGRDGHCCSEQGGQYVPQGQSLWEIGSPADVDKKVKDDLEKRATLCEADGNSPADITFVFVTFRKWSQKSEMQRLAEHYSQLSPFKEVRLYDAVTLEDWLHASPAVTRFVRAKYLGFAPHDVGWKSAQEHLDEFSQRYDFGELVPKPVPGGPPLTIPEFSSQLLFEGYDEQLEDLRERLKAVGRYGVAAETEDEAAAFIAAAILKDPSLQALGSRTIYIDDPEAISQFLDLVGHILILPEQASAKSGHRLSEQNTILTVSTRFSQSKDALRLFPRSTETFAAGLAACGFESAVTYNLAARYGRSLSVLWRHAPRSGYRLAPPWHAKVNSLIVRTIVLLGALRTDYEGDLGCLVKLHCGDTRDACDELAECAKGPDPIVRRVDTLYALSSPVDALTFGAEGIRTKDLDTFGEIFTEVFNHRPPKPPDPETFYSPTRSKSRYSEDLHEGLAKTALIMSAQGKLLELEHQGQPVQEFLEKLFKEVIHQDRFLEFLETHRHLTSYFAEAFPEGFLKALGEWIEGSEDGGASLFATRRDALGGRFPYLLPQLMSAISVLLWSEGHFEITVQLLAKLADIDVDDQSHSPRPLSVLHGVFSSWCPQTGVADQLRLKALREMLDYAPRVAQEIIVAAMPETQESQSSHSKPVFMPAQEPNRTYGDIWAFQTEAAYLLFGSNVDPADWLKEGLRRFSRLPEDAFNPFLRILEKSLIEERDPQLWNDLVRLTDRHEKHSDKDWSLPAERVAKLKALATQHEPNDPRLRYERLFDWNADWDSLEGESRQKALERQRREALSKIYAEQSDDGIIALAKAARNKHDVIVQISKELSLKAALDLAFRGVEEGFDGWPPAAASTLFERFGMEFIGELQSRLSVGAITEQQFGYAISGAFRCKGTLDAVWSLPDDLQNMVWRETGHYAFLDLAQGQSDRIAERLIEAGSPQAALHQAPDFLSSLSSAILLKLVQAVMHKSSDLKNQLPARELLEQVSELAKRGDVDEMALLQIELPFIQHAFYFDEHDWVTFGLIGEQPELFIEFLEGGYLKDGEKFDKDAPDPRTEAEKAWAKTAFYVLYQIDDAGFAVDDNIDKTRFLTWAEAVLERAAEKERTEAAEIVLGRILAHIPPTGATSDWPTATVASIIDHFDSRRVERSLATTRFNNRGAFMGDGVDHSLKWARIHEDAANRLQGFPVTQAFLRACAERDRRDAQEARKRRDQRDLSSKL